MPPGVRSDAVPHPGTGLVPGYSRFATTVRCALLSRYAGMGTCRPGLYRNVVLGVDGQEEGLAHEVSAAPVAIVILRAACWLSKPTATSRIPFRQAAVTSLSSMPAGSVTWLQNRP
jgi:hypothetical protein